MSKTDVNVAIIGVTRRTAAIGQALRDYTGRPNAHLNFHVSVFDESQEREREAKEIGAIDRTGRMNAIAREAHIVIVDQTPGNLQFAYDIFGPELRSGAVVLDFSSVQRYVQELAVRYFPKDENGSPTAYLVGVAPLVKLDWLYDSRMAVTDANPDVYLGSEMIIAAPAFCPPEAVKLAADLAEILGMKPTFMEPSEYDGLVDFTENMPLLMSTALFAMLERSRARQELEKTINPGFALATARLRDLKPQDLAALWQNSRDNTIHHIDELMEVLRELRRVMATGDEDALNELSQDLIMAFGMWEDRRKRGPKQDQPAMPQRGGLFRNLFGMGALESQIDKKNTSKR